MPAVRITSRAPSTAACSDANRKSGARTGGRRERGARDIGKRRASPGRGAGGSPENKLLALILAAFLVAIAVTILLVTRTYPGLGRVPC